MATGDRAVMFTASTKDEETVPLLTDSGRYISPPVPEVGDRPPSRDFGRRRSSTAKLAMERLILTRERLWSTAVSSLVASIPALLVGFTIGFPSPVLTELNSDSIDQKYKFDYLLQDLFAAFSPIGAVIGGLVAGWVADHAGRKPTLLLSGLPYMAGYLMMAYAHFVSTATQFKATMLTGRFLTGFSLGWSCLAVPVYLGEMSSAKLRGVFGTFTQLYLSGGVLVVYALSNISGLHYYHMALVAVGVVAGFELGMVWLPETPRWLFSQQRREEGERVLKWLRGPKISIAAELKDIEAGVSAKKLTVLQVLREFTKRRVFFPLSLLLVIMFFQQISGLNAISSFATLLFQEAGVGNPELASLFAVGITAFIATFISSYIIDLAGRKFLLIVSGLGMIAGTVMLGTHFYITRASLCSSHDHHNITTSLPVLEDSSDSCNTHFAPLAISSLIFFNVSFSFGWGPVPWILMTELLTQKVRGVASGMATFVNWGTAGIVIGFYLDYARAVEPWFAWWSFSVLNALGVVFVCVFIPETKGKPLEEIQQRFDRCRRTGKESELTDSSSSKVN